MISTTDGIIVGSLAAKALRDIGSKIPFFSITLDQAAIDAADGGFEGLEFLTFLTPKPRFKADYEAKFKTAIDIGADSAYDAVMMLAQAIDQAKTVDTAAVAEKLAAITEFKGVSGSLVSDGKRGFQKKESVKVVRQGRAADLEN